MHLLPRTASVLAIALAVPLLMFAACGDDDASTTGSGGASSSSGDGGGIVFDGGPMGSSGVGGAGTGGMQNTGGEGQVSHVWDNVYSGPGGAFTKDVAIDNNGNVIVVGSFSGIFDFGGGPETSSGGGSNLNIFVAKYSSAGDFLWARTFGNGNPQSATAVAVDAQGNIGLCGLFIGSVNFGGGNLTNSDQFANIYIAKLAPDGMGHIFSSTFTNPVGTTDDCQGVAFDPVGNLWATGWFQNQIDFGGGTLDAVGDSGDRDVFVAKFGINGNHLTSVNFGGTAYEQAIDIAAAPNGDIAVVGYTEGEMSFGGSTIPNTEGRRAFAARLTNNAEEIFSNIFYGSGDGTAVSTTFHSSGDMFVAGNFKDGIDLGAGELAAVGANDDIFAARYDSAGMLQYGVKLSSTATERVSGLAVDADGYAVLAGRFNGDLNVNGSSMLMTGGSFDGFIIKLGPPGNGFWGYGFGDDQVQAATAVAIGSDNTMVLVGDFSGDLDLGSGSVGGNFSQDIFIAKFSD